MSIIVVENNGISSAITESFKPRVIYVKDPIRRKEIKIKPNSHLMIEHGLWQSRAYRTQRKSPDFSEKA